MKKCADHAARGRGIAVLLIPARTDTKWFHDLIWKKPNVEIRFIKGRLKFDNPDHKRNTAPFPSMIVIFHLSEYGPSGSASLRLGWTFSTKTTTTTNQRK